MRIDNNKRDKAKSLHGHTSRKRFGQHFLTDPSVIDRITSGIAPKVGQALVEIGPGLGALTNAVVAHCERLTVIELDRDLAVRLSHRPELNVVQADVLRVDFNELSTKAGQALRIIGNLPYNVSTPILFHLLAFADVIADQHFMLQKEVVDRMVAQPGNKEFGRLSVMLQWRYSMQCVVDVPPSAFEPPPKVNSAVVSMVPLPNTSHIDPKRLGELVRVAFSQRRKLLRHTLGPWLKTQGIDIAFDLQRRAEEVSTAEYIALALIKPAIASD